MEDKLRDVVCAALQRCRQDGCKADVLQLAYTACLLEEAAAWGPAPPPEVQRQQQAQQQQEQLSLCGPAKLTDAAAALMADRLAQEVSQPADLAAAATATLQVALARAFQEQQHRLEDEQAAAATEVARLAAAVAYKKVHLQTARLPEYQQVFERVVDYVAAAIGVAAKTAADAAARAGVAAAVESAFPLAGMAHFRTLPAAERMQQLESLARVTCGICLYNDTQGAQAPPLMPPGPAAQLQHSLHLLATIEAAAATAEQAMAHHNFPSTSSSSGSGSAAAGGSLGAALFCCQAVATMRRLAADLAGGISCCQALEGGLEATMLQVERHVGSSPAAVPKAAVFPLFDSAGQLHMALAGELRLLVVRARLWEATTAALAAAAAHPAVPHVLQFKGRLGGYSSSSGGGSGRMGLGGSLAVLSEAEAAELPADVEYLPPAGLHSGGSGGADAAAAASLALSGFCPVSLSGSAAAAAAGAGTGGSEQQAAVLLVGRLAQPALGCIRYQGVLFGFCSAAALRSFAEAPGLTLAGVRQAVHRAPLLAHLLGLAAGQGAAADADAARSSLASVGLTCGVPPLRQLMQLLTAPIRVDAGSQTPTHFTERHIDVDYEWNEWALRRRVIALANLRNKATHGAQTLLSHFRRDGDSQTWALKAAGVQTQVNTGSSMPRKLRYVTDLRGPPATTKMKVVSLELDIGQTHQH